ncbi:MAG: hydrogenase maturation protease [Candidatus Diapherotrites archaeon]|nr:hydrogenase maturation protease [Candidatus Diapherotrites archaeon]
MKVILSIGNPINKDDNIANLIIDKLTLPENTKIFKGFIMPENFMIPISKLNPEVLYIIDAIDFKGNIGDIKVFEMDDFDLVPETTHNVPISFFKRFVDCKYIVIGIQPKDVSTGEEITEELKNKESEIVEKINSILQ